MSLRRERYEQVAGSGRTGCADDCGHESGQRANHDDQRGRETFGHFFGSTRQRLTGGADVGGDRPVGEPMSDDAYASEALADGDWRMRLVRRRQRTGERRVPRPGQTRAAQVSPWLYRRLAPSPTLVSTNIRRTAPTACR
jgi:hypothetical protein